MRTRAIGAVIVLLVMATTGCDVLISGPGGGAAQAERRVRTMLDAMVSLQTRGARESDLALAESMWWNGRSQLPDPNVASRAGDLFREWREQKGLVYGGLGEYEIVEVIEPDAPGRPVVVAVRIDGRPLRLEVVENEPIRWGQ